MAGHHKTRHYSSISPDISLVLTPIAVPLGVPIDSTQTPSTQTPSSGHFGPCEVRDPQTNEVIGKDWARICHYDANGNPDYGNARNVSGDPKKITTDPCVEAGVDPRFLEMDVKAPSGRVCRAQGGLRHPKLEL